MRRGTKMGTRDVRDLGGSASAGSLQFKMIHKVKKCLLSADFFRTFNVTTINSVLKDMTYSNSPP